MSQSLIFQTIAKYSEPWRKFHTMQHLAYLWKSYEAACAENPGYRSYQDIMPYLIPFHDWVYVPGYNKNEEDSADFAEYYFTKVMGMDLVSPLATYVSNPLSDDPNYIHPDAYLNSLCRRVPDIIRGTKHHLNPKDQLEALFFDMDLCGMGSEWNTYLYTSKQISEEYSQVVGPHGFYQGRKAFAESILSREKIYNLPEFQKFDAPTRRNLLKELEEAERVARIFFPSSQ
jgi:predicted metal-dependent HD superfamily phosphohydrolase